MCAVLAAIISAADNAAAKSVTIRIPNLSLAGLIKTICATIKPLLLGRRLSSSELEKQQPKLSSGPTSLLLWPKGMKRVDASNQP